MTVQMQTIKKADQADAIHMMWVLLQELENKVDGTDDLFGRRNVEAGYRMWNRITGDDKVAVWELRSPQPTDSRVWTTMEEGPDDGDGYTLENMPTEDGIYYVISDVGQHGHVVMDKVQFHFNQGGRTATWSCLLTGHPVTYGSGDMWARME